MEEKDINKNFDLLEIEYGFSNLTVEGLIELEKLFDKKLRYNSIQYLLNGTKAYFPIYGEERYLPVNIYPIVINNREWIQLEKAIKQRHMALNYFINDVYSGKETPVPNEIVKASMYFDERLINTVKTSEPRAHLYGPDLIKVDGKYMFLEDNIGVPSGYAYITAIVLMHKPGDEIEISKKPEEVLWTRKINKERAIWQHNELVEVYRNNNVKVEFIDDINTLNYPNMIYMRDTFTMTISGAIVSRLASDVRAGEEKIVTRKLADLNIPILFTPFGDMVIEGPDILIINENLAFIGISRLC